MKSRDEILEDVSHLRLSSRSCFYDLLDQYSIKRLASGEVVKISWPQALGVVSLKDWNSAFEIAMEMSADIMRPDSGFKLTGDYEAN